MYHNESSELSPRRNPMAIPLCLRRCGGATRKATDTTPRALVRAVQWTFSARIVTALALADGAAFSARIVTVLASLRVPACGRPHFLTLPCALTLAVAVFTSSACQTPSDETGSSRHHAQPRSAATYACEWTSAGRPTELPRLGCPEDHVKLAGEPLATSLPASQSVMFLIERDRDNALHFFDSARWRHYSFARERLSGYGELSSFNAEMYYRPERRLFLGTLAHYLAEDVYALEVAPIDKTSPELLDEMFAVVRANIGWSAELRYHPTSNALEMAERLPAEVPVVTTAQLYQNATYQGMHLGRTVGRIRLTKLASIASEYIRRDDILVLDHVPNDLPAAAGLVTAEFQTPLSHVNLLSQNRGTPNMTLIGATTDPRFVENQGRWVELVVRANGFSVRPSSASAAERFWSERRPPDTQFPALDLASEALLDVTELGHSDVARVGGKAANFGELTRVRPALPLPPGFAIPCAQYVRFMQSNGFDTLVERLIADPVLMEDAHARASALGDLRKKILAAKLDSALLDAIQARATALFGAVPTRLRSSSNVEDLAEFNGAGLYESHSWDANDWTKPLDLALKRVWASLWTERAFDERDWARVDQRFAAMGVLVHPSFPDATELANGVAITANPFDPPPNGQAAFYINVQPGAASVTNPDPSVVPESFLYYKPPAGQGEISYLSASSLAGGSGVLSFPEIVELVQSLQAIDEHFARIYRDAPRFGMDVEFKLVTPQRDLVIKQARRYPF